MVYLLDCSSLFPGRLEARTLQQLIAVAFIHLFAPHYEPRLIRDAARAQSQEEVDNLVHEIPLPLKAGCEQDIAK